MPPSVTGRQSSWRLVPRCCHSPEPRGATHTQPGRQPPVMRASTPPIGVAAVAVRRTGHAPTGRVARPHTATRVPLSSPGATRGNRPRVRGAAYAPHAKAGGTQHGRQVGRLRALWRQEDLQPQRRAQLPVCMRPRAWASAPGHRALLVLRRTWEAASRSRPKRPRRNSPRTTRSSRRSALTKQMQGAGDATPQLKPSVCVQPI